MQEPRQHVTATHCKLQKCHEKSCAIVCAILDNHVKYFNPLSNLEKMQYKCIISRVLAILISCLCVGVICGVNQFNNGTSSWAFLYPPDCKQPQITTLMGKNSWDDWYRFFKKRVKIGHDHQVQLWKDVQNIQRPILKQIESSVAGNSMLRLLPQVTIVLLDHMNNIILNNEEKTTIKEKEEYILNTIWDFWVFSHIDAEDKDLCEIMVNILIKAKFFKKTDLRYLGKIGKTFTINQSMKYIEKCENLLKNNEEYLKNKYMDDLVKRAGLNPVNNNTKVLFEKFRDLILSQYRDKRYAEERISIIFHMFKTMNDAVEAGQAERNGAKKAPITTKEEWISSNRADSSEEFDNNETSLEIIRGRKSNIVLYNQF